MFRKLFSYLIPINILKQKSVFSKSLEVTWANGQLVLDSKNTNYSFGSLQRILKVGLKTIGFDKIKEMQDVLVLGVAGGSVIKTLVDDFKYKGNITGVEIDKEVIEIANRYFQLNEIPNLKIVIDDAFEFVLKTKDKYNLIIVDVFQDTTMPYFLFETYFIERINSLLKSGGFLIFNTMILDKKDLSRNKKYISEFNEKQFKVRVISRIDHNELIIIKKIA